MASNSLFLNVLTDAKTAETKRRARALWLVGCLSLFSALVVLVATGFTVYSNWAYARRDAKLADANRVYLRSLNNILGALKDAETGQRGYVITGQNHYLDPYRQALGPIDDGLNSLSQVAASRPDQKEPIAHIQRLIRLKLGELASTIQRRESQGFDAARGELLTDLGSKAMDEIRAECKSLSDEQYADLVARSVEVQKHQLDAMRLASGGGVLLFCLMLAGFIALNSGSRQQANLAEMLADSKEVFETTLTSIGDGVISTDQAGRITFINPEAASLTGWTRPEALGKHLNEVFRMMRNEAGGEVKSPFEYMMQTGKIMDIAKHTMLLRRDGSQIAIDDSLSPIRNIYGKVNGVVLVFRDITERRRDEEALALSHSRVLQANEELRQFSYAATHDLQEPLRTIVIFSQLLVRSYSASLDERGLHLLQTVEDAARRMSALIDHLLAYTRVGSLDSARPSVTVSAASVLEDTLVQLNGAIEESGAKITSDELPEVWVEPAQLSHVFQNLLSNAIKYRKLGTPPVIHVSAKVENDCATIQITDNGMGFKQEYAERIFLLFQRLHGRPISGTGIGLALCRRIIERQGGRIWATSEENVGSSFFFTLPIVQKTSSANPVC